MEKNKTISQEELEQLMRDAELGDADAQYNLAYCYEYGETPERSATADTGNGRSDACNVLSSPNRRAETVA